MWFSSERSLLQSPPVTKRAEPARANKEKRVRMERKELEDLLFELFDKQTYYKMKELIDLTQQPKVSWEGEDMLFFLLV